METFWIAQLTFIRDMVSSFGSFPPHIFCMYYFLGKAVICRVKVLLVLKPLLKACGELTKNLDDCRYKRPAILAWVPTDQIHFAQISHQSLETSFADRILANCRMVKMREC